MSETNQVQKSNFALLRSRRLVMKSCDKGSVCKDEGEGGKEVKGRMLTRRGGRRGDTRSEQGKRQESLIFGLF